MLLIVITVRLSVTLKIIQYGLMLLMIAEGGRGECFIIDLFDPRR